MGWFVFDGILNIVALTLLTALSVGLFMLVMALVTIAIELLEDAE